MNRRRYRSEVGVVVGELIRAILDYRLKRPLTRTVIVILLTGGIGLLGVGPIGQLIGAYVTWFEPISATSGSVLIAVGLGLYVWNRLEGIGRPLIVEPNQSYFHAHKRPEDKGDPRNIIGRGFSITVDVTLVAQRRQIFVRRVRLDALHRGMHCLATTQSIRIDGRLVDHVGVEDPKKGTHQTYRRDYEYNIMPAVELAAGSPVELSVQRDFGPPFVGRGAPDDFGRAELLVTIEYVVGGKTRSKEFYFSSDHQTGRLESMDAIPDVPYLSKRDLAFWHREGVISTDQRNALWAIDDETRLRAAESDECVGEFARNSDVAPETVIMIRRLRDRRGELPVLDREAVWRTPFGRLCRLIIQGLRWLATRAGSR